MHKLHICMHGKVKWGGARMSTDSRMFSGSGFSVDKKVENLMQIVVSEFSLESRLVLESPKGFGNAEIDIVTCCFLFCLLVRLSVCMLITCTFLFN